MKHQISILAFLCFSIWLPIVGGAQSQLPKQDAKLQAIEKHYEFLETEAKALRESFQKENETFRKFIQEERAQHQSFLETTIKWGAGLMTIVGAVLLFFGWNTFQGINKSREEIEAAATTQILEYAKALNESQARLHNAQQNMLDLEKSYQEHINFYRNANPKNGRYLFIGSKEKLEQMAQNEFKRFEQVFGQTETLDLSEVGNGKFYPAVYDVVVYRSNVDSGGQDGTLERVIGLLDAHKNIPLVVFAANRDEWLKGETERKFNERNLVHLANNQISLIDNVAAAYRVSKLLPKT